jgi:A/G-specific adenine glycosylase
VSPDPHARAVRQLIRWFEREGPDLPWRRTRDRWAILVSEVMLQATPVARVIPYYEAWMARWPTAQSLAGAPLGDAISAWQGLGYPRRARNLHAAATVISQSGWPEPHRYHDLPGVGEYTSAAIRCFADEAPVLPEDVNVRRVVARRFPGGWPGAPRGRSWHAGQAMMDLGREFCRARAPLCDSGCPVRSGCPAADAGTVDEVTPRSRRQARYEGSMRQRRGFLLRALTEDGRARAAADPEAADSLVDDGLAERRGALLLPVGSGDA